MKPRPPGSNNLLGDLPLAAKQQRDQIENAIALCLAVNHDIAEVETRISQAMRRSTVVEPVLHPAAQRVAEIRACIEQLHAELGAYWRTGQSHRWQG